MKEIQKVTARVFMFVFMFVFMSASFALTAAAQERMPQASPAAMVKQTIGLNEVAVTYHRPGVKGRKIWGGLVPYGQVWRTGANEATNISFAEDVTIEGQALPAGTYALLTIPGEKEWAVIFNKNAKAWGSFGYKEDQDALRVKVTPVSATNEESLSFRFQNVTLESAKLVLAWEKLEIPFLVKNKADTNARVLAGLEEKIASAKPGDPGPYIEAAAYCYDQKVNLEEAMKWIDKAIALKSTLYGHFVKSELLALAKNPGDSTAELEKALKAAGPDDPAPLVQEIRDRLKKAK